jgi:hypothetical protein
VRRGLLSCALALSACRGQDVEGEASGPTESGGEQVCVSSEDCSGDDVCVAPYDGMGKAGVFECVPECMTDQMLELWCADDRACCEGFSCSNVGVCEGPETETTG